MKRTGQEGFSLLGILVSVMIIGILATIAVPKFTSAIAMANTSKVKADLTTLDAAIAVYETQEGHRPKDIGDLSNYVSDLEKLKPPQGECRLNDGSTIKVTDKSYSLQNGDTEGEEKVTKECRALCAGHTAADFGK